MEAHVQLWDGGLLTLSNSEVSLPAILGLTEQGIGVHRECSRHTRCSRLRWDIGISIPRGCCYPGYVGRRHRRG